MNELDWMREKVGRQATDSEVRYLVSLMERVEGDAGSKLVSRGTWGDSLYLLVDGRLRAFVSGAGRRLELGTIQPGNWIGEMHFVDPGPSSASVEAETPFVALRLRNELLDTMLRDNPTATSQLLRSIVRQVADRLVRTGAGAVERVGEGDFRVGDPDEPGGWLEGLFRWMFGGWR